MAVNIKDEGASDLIRELAEVTGETMTAATREAVRERLDRLRSETSGERVAVILELARDLATRLDAAAATTDHSAFLYGDDGMPR